MARRDTDADGMPPLQRLIVEQMRRKGWSPQQVEDRGVSHSTLYMYTQPLTLRSLPRDATIDKLAEALDLTPDQIREAAWQSIEANRGRSKDTDKARRGKSRVEQPVGLGLDDEASELSPEQIESVRAVIRAMKQPGPQ